MFENLSTFNNDLLAACDDHNFRFLWKKLRFSLLSFFLSLFFYLFIYLLNFYLSFFPSFFLLRGDIRSSLSWTCFANFFMIRNGYILNMESCVNLLTFLLIWLLYSAIICLIRFSHPWVLIVAFFLIHNVIIIKFLFYKSWDALKYD